MNAQLRGPVEEFSDPVNERRSLSRQERIRTAVRRLTDRERLTYLDQFHSRHPAIKATWDAFVVATVIEDEQL
jgi:hypothetical protein